MGYETKVLLVALAELARKSTTAEEVFNHIAKMANAEGVIIGKYEENDADRSPN